VRRRSYTNRNKKKRNCAKQKMVGAAVIASVSCTIAIFIATLLFLRDSQATQDWGFEVIRGFQSSRAFKNFSFGQFSVQNFHFVVLFLFCFFFFFFFFWQFPLLLPLPLLLLLLQCFQSFLLSSPLAIGIERTLFPFAFAALSYMGGKELAIASVALAYAIDYRRGITVLWFVTVTGYLVSLFKILAHQPRPGMPP
jgi:hypothetical protein